MSRKLCRRERPEGVIKQDRGQAQIEFVMSIMTILVVIFMAVELCSAVYAYVVLSDAANEGLRYAVAHSSALPDGGQSFTVAKVQSYTSKSLHNMSAMTVSVTPSTWASGDTVTVSISYPFAPYLSFMTNPPTMHAYAQGKCVF